MTGQQFLRLQYQFVQQVCRLLCGESSLLHRSLFDGLDQQGAPFLVGVIVGWGTNNVLRAPFDDQQVAILDACNELHPLASLTFVDGLGQLLVQVFDEYVGILRFQIASVVGDDLAVFQRDDVTAYGHIVVSHIVAYGGCLQWSATFIHLVQVVPQDGCVGHFAARREPLGHCDESPCAPFTCQLVHHGFACILQQCLTSQSLNGQVSHSVSKYYNVLHKQKPC